MSTQTSRTTLRLGSKNEDVLRLQGTLNALGFGPLDEDGKFGTKTEAAVKKYQKSRGLSADGIVGPQTWARILHDTN